MTIIYSPYATSLKPFTIGLSALSPSRWIEPDDQLAAYLAEKRQLIATRKDDVFRETADSRAAQQECLEAIVLHLTQQHADLYSRNASLVTVAETSVDISDEQLPPLIRAGLLVQDDLVIMRRRETGWHIAAGHLSFPSSWVLAEKFNRPMEEVHAHVPGFQGGTRNAMMINRIFDNLLPEQPAERFNWSINWQKKLYHPETGRDDAAEPDTAVVRVERQTLTKLPISGDIVFTIRIYLDPVSLFANHPEGTRLAQALADQLDALTNEQTNYKGLNLQRDRLVAFLSM